MNRKILFSALIIATLEESILGQHNSGKICSVCSCFDKTIDCRNRRLNSSFDAASWSELTESQYQEAFFDNNHIGHLIKFPSLPFEKLSYKNNQLVKVDEKAFKNLTALVELDLSENELTSDNLVPEIFEGPYTLNSYEPLQLRILDLSVNELHTLHPDIFRHLPKLERLYLKQNPFLIIDKPTVIALSSIPNLQVLDLSFTKLKSLPNGFLHTPRKLFELVLKGNFFTEIPSDVLVESQSLKILNLNENPIKVISSEKPFPEMPKLKQLHISFMPNLQRIEARSLSGLTGLDYLYCRMNEKLEYISPLAFIKNDTDKKWPNIIKLDLSDNALRYIDYEFLKPGWEKIKHINLIGNPLVCDCENQWIVSKLVPLMMNITSPVDGLICAEPSAMKGQRLVTLYEKNYTMRCLDMYGNHPENDGPILVSIFVIVILLLIIVLGAVIWFKNNNTCRQGGRVNYQRAFYKPAKLDDSDRC